MTAASKAFSLMFGLALVRASYEKKTSTPAGGPEYTTDAQLKLPEQYREWVYLTSDFYAPSDSAKMQADSGQRSFNNILVEPNAYRAFLETGAWPDKTMLAVDVRAAAEMEPAAPNQTGTAQGAQKGLAIHVKDEARFPGKWAFFGFGAGATTGKMIPVTANCYSCHAAKGAVDTTFVQYYPTLLPVAKSKNTLRPEDAQEHEKK